MGILDKLLDFIDLDEGGENQNEGDTTSRNSLDQKQNEDTPIKLSEVTDFIRELESYYTNDIFKERSEFINANLSEDEIVLLKKRIAEDEGALEDISCIKDKVIEQERSCSEIWGKSSYSFYDKLESRKLEEIFKETFEIIKKLVEANVKEELDEIIIDRLKVYYKSWKIGSEFTVPINTGLRIKSRSLNKKTNLKEEVYQFGVFQKRVIAEDENTLLKEQIEALKKMQIQISELANTQSVWIRCVTITREQLNFIKKTLVFPNDWEVGENDKLTYDIVNTEELEYYIRSVLQLILSKKDYVLISMLIPNSNLLQGIVRVDDAERKVTILDKEKYVLMERNGAYNNLKFNFISRKEDLRQLSFISYETFVKPFLNG